ncbi:hypothetical protein [Streptomyces parvus]|uniref:hypothetical protein n=1 Tax=Streptomyces parvus TaxID=66428 RepID=UPI0033F7A885
MGRAQAEGLQLTGKDRLLRQLTKRLLESAQIRRAVKASGHFPNEQTVCLSEEQGRRAV